MFGTFSHKACGCPRGMCSCKEERKLTTEERINQITRNIDREIEELYNLSPSCAKEQENLVLKRKIKDLNDELSEFKKKSKPTVSLKEYNSTIKELNNDINLLYKIVEKVLTKKQLRVWHECDLKEFLKVVKQIKE